MEEEEYGEEKVEGSREWSKRRKMDEEDGGTSKNYVHVNGLSAPRKRIQTPPTPHNKTPHTSHAQMRQLLYRSPRLCHTFVA